MYATFPVSFPPILFYFLFSASFFSFSPSPSPPISISPISHPPYLRLPSPSPPPKNPTNHNSLPPFSAYLYYAPSILETKFAKRLKNAVAPDEFRPGGSSSRELRWTECLKGVSFFGVFCAGGSGGLGHGVFWKEMGVFLGWGERWGLDWMEFLRGQWNGQERGRGEMGIRSAKMNTLFFYYQSRTLYQIYPTPTKKNTPHSRKTPAPRPSKPKFLYSLHLPNPTYTSFTSPKKTPTFSRGSKYPDPSQTLIHHKYKRRTRPRPRSRNPAAPI